MLFSIKGKTVAAFDVIILFSIITTFVLILNTADVADNTIQFYEAPYSGKDAVWALRRNFLDNQRALYKFLSTPEAGRRAERGFIRDSVNCCDGGGFRNFYDP